MYLAHLLLKRAWRTRSWVLNKAPLPLLSRSRSGKGSWGSRPEGRCGASADGCAKAVPAGHMLLVARRRASDGRAAAA